MMRLGSHVHVSTCSSVWVCISACTCMTLRHLVCEIEGYKLTISILIRVVFDGILTSLSICISEVEL